MKRLTWGWWLAGVGVLFVAIVFLGLNRVHAHANQTSSSAVVPVSSSPGQFLATRDRDEDEAKEDEEHEGKEAREHEEHEGKEAREHEEHEGKEAREHEEHEKHHEGKEEEEEDEDEQTICFSKADLGKVPKGWVVGKTGKGKGSVWKVVADKTAPSGTGYVLAQLAKSPGRVFNLCVLDDSKYKDVEVEVRFKAVKGNTDQGGGIVWRYLDENNYYVARMNPLEDNYRFYKVKNGKRTMLATKEGVKVPAGEWHTLKIECKGNKIECELDGKELLEKTDNTFKKAGKVGLWTKADARTRFDKFEIEVKDDDD